MGNIQVCELLVVYFLKSEYAFEKEKTKICLMVYDGVGGFLGEKMYFNKCLLTLFTDFSNLLK